MKLSSSLLVCACLCVLSQMLLPSSLLAEDPAARAGDAIVLPPAINEPVIQHEYSSQLTTLLLISALEVEGKSLRTPVEADRLFKNTQKSIGDMQDEGPSQAAANNLSRDASRLLAYYLTSGTGDDTERAKTAAKWLDTYSAQSAEGSKKPDQKARYQYFNALAKFYISEGGDGISALVPLRSIPGIDKVLAANIDLLLGYSLALSPATTAQGYGYMAQATANVSVYGRVAQKLVEAYVESGLDADGALTQAAKPSSAAKMTYAIQIARGMPPALQHIVMNTAIFIWIKSAPSPDGKAPAYLTEGFKGIIPVEAFREKDAMNELKKQNYKAASALYRLMGASINDPLIKMKIDRRIWDIELLNYQKSKQISDLEATFTALRDKQQAQPKGPGSAAAAAQMKEISASYRGALDSMLTAALQPAATAADRSSSIDVSARYIKIESDRQIAYPLKIKLAQLYRSLNQFKNAVDLYLDLARDQGLKNFLLAIEAQSQLAKWPAQPPFEGTASGPTDERSRLLSIYESVSKIKVAGDEWFVTAHIGLLERALGMNQKAEELWLRTLKVQLGSKFALEAGGLLLTEFYAAKRWQSYIDLGHIFGTKKLTPTTKGKPFNYQPWMADSLYNGALADLQQKIFPRSVKNFEEFVQVFATDPRVPMAIYTSAFAHRGMNKPTLALAACRSVIDKYPQFALRSKVMLQGAEWAAADRTTWEYAFFFYTKYLLEFKNESNVPQIRMTLADLYMKRKLYGWASRLYKEQSLATTIPKDQQLVAAVKYLEIEERYGEPKDAFWGAQRIAQLAGPKDPAFLKSLAYQGRFIAKSKDLKAISEMEARLLPYSKTSRDILESLGSLRFHKAEMLTQTIVYTENNLLIRDPEATVKKYYDRFEAEKIHYISVCQLGVTTSCAPAFYRLTNVSRQGYDAVKKVEIASTLGPNRVNSFNVFKQLYLSKIQQIHKGFVEQAVKMSKQGTTTPMWRDEIVKSLEYDDAINLAH